MDNNDARLQMTFQAQKKSTGAAYLLWFFLGGLGGHRFYLGQTGTAITQLILFG
jgi:TM2 domain-containing membrane protein YozV